MKYRDLIQFDPIETVVQLRHADEEEAARRLVATYVISDEMAERLSGVAIPQLRFDRPADNKGLLVVGDYGTGKSHLMSVVSAVAERAELADELDHRVREAARPIAGKFKVVRTELGATRMDLRTFVCSTLEDALESWGVKGGFHFPAPDSIPNHKKAFEDMMAAFHRQHPGLGLLLVVDELLDYLRSRNDLQLVKDLTFMREVGEVCRHLRFRFVAGLQESIFDSPRFAHVADSVRRVQDRFQQLRIARNDIKHVVAERLLKKSDEQRAKVRGHLAPFTKFYGRMHERLDDFVRLFPVHPDYVATFERLAVVEKRQVLNTLSEAMKARIDDDVPAGEPGLVAFDGFWETLRGTPSYRAVPEVRDVIDCSDVLEARIKAAFTRPLYRPMALRIIHALSVHRLTHRDIHAPLGATPEELRDELCLYQPGIEDMGSGEPAEDLRGQVETVLREIRRTVSGQFISFNRENGQHYLDLKKTEDFDERIDERAKTLDPGQLNRWYYGALKRVMECADETYVTGYTIWEHELEWRERRASRRGYLFFGAPNERSTAVPVRDFYLYFLPPWQQHGFKDEELADEVFFRLKELDEGFEQTLRRGTAAAALASRASGHSKEVYLQKADGYFRDLAKWLRKRLGTALKVTHQGSSRRLVRWLPGKHVGSSGGQTVRDMVNAAASAALAPHFAEQARDYPVFHDYHTAANRPHAATDALRWIAGLTKTRQAARVLDALELLDGERLDPARSKYAMHILGKLRGKGAGKVLNRPELVETVREVDYLVPDSFRLEPEWMVVLLAALVYSGDLVVAVPGKRFDASGLEEMAGAPIDDLIHFKHLDRPKDWNLPGMGAMFELLDLPPGQAQLVTQGKAGPVRELQRRIDNRVKHLVAAASEVRAGVLFWDEAAMSDDVAESMAERMDKTKAFLESVRPLNTPGKLKNFIHGSERVRRLGAGLKDLAAYRALKDMVRGEVGDMATYLARAAEVLADDDAWTTTAQDAKQQVVPRICDRATWTDRSFRTRTVRELRQLKQEYIKAYMKLHRRARLGADGDKRKKMFLSGERLARLTKLSSIDLLPREQLDQIRHRLDGLESCLVLTKHELEHKPRCPQCRFHPSAAPASPPAQGELEAIDRELDRVLDQWTNALADNLSDPAMGAQLALLAPAERRLIETFAASRTLPGDLTDDFLQTVREMLSGLSKVVLTGGGMLVALASGGLPATPDEMRKRFDVHLAEMVRGLDPAKVRIVLGEPQ